MSAGRARCVVGVADRVHPRPRHRLGLAVSAYTPKHRRCTRARHHAWIYRGPTVTGWMIARCSTCGKTDLA